MLPRTSLPTLIPACQRRRTGIDGSYEYSSAIDEVTDTATSSTAPIAPTITAARRSPFNSRCGATENRSTALSFSSPVNCHRATISQPVIEAATVPPTAPRKGIGHRERLGTTNIIVRIETPATASIANGTGVCPSASLGTNQPSSRKSEKKSPRRAFTPAKPVRTEKATQANVMNPATAGIRYLSLIENCWEPSSNVSTRKRYSLPGTSSNLLSASWSISSSFVSPANGPFLKVIRIATRSVSHPLASCRSKSLLLSSTSSSRTTAESSVFHLLITSRSAPREASHAIIGASINKNSVYFPNFLTIISS
ncbi:MAG: hypothetical protein BWY99_02700 [Synergistetes bacterium ADurb.BinA166]|nr:MAG: hypothetical protein BWY99_02700 [Synergistetes bacterium ADurb.BinA166]